MLRMRPCRLLACLILLGTSALPSQEPPKAQPLFAIKPGSQPQGKVVGHILCGDTRRPARGAMVMLQRVTEGAGPATGLNAARVGNDGSYEIDHVAAGTYSVVAMLPGYLSPLDDLVVHQGQADFDKLMRAKLAEHGTVTVHENGTTAGDVTLERGAAISGRVLFPDGSPATQVTLQLEPVDQKPAGKGSSSSINAGSMMRLMFTRQTTSTDDQGHFRVSGITPGKYRIVAVPVPSSVGGAGDGAGIGNIMGMSNDPVALRVYVGDTLHRKDAKVFELRSADEIADLQITLPINSFHQVSGRLTAKDGRALSVATLKLTDTADPTLSFGGSLGEDGVFSFPAVPAGTYLLTASEGKIMKPNTEMPAFMAMRMGTSVAAFAEGSTSVLVKDSDLTDVALALIETALPPTPKETSEADSEPQ